MPAPSAADRLRSIRTLPQLLAYLRDELDWPVGDLAVEDVTFDYDADELGVPPEAKVGFREIKQIRPLAAGQPWGVFWVSFEKKRLPVVLLRRVLAALAVRRRPTGLKVTRAAWQPEDLLFISSYGESDDAREISLAHFTVDLAHPGELPVLRVLDWDAYDTALKLQHLDHTLHEHLRWPANERDLGSWRKQWRAPFRHRIGHVIRTASDLADTLAGLARAIRHSAEKLLAAESDRGPLRRLYRAFQVSLIHDLTEAGFADTYAQTITYGLLTAAISRTDMGAGSEGTVLGAGDVVELVPVTNPFLKEMLDTFLRVGGRKGAIDFDELGIHNVVDLLRGDETDLPAILRDFGNKKPGEDPVIHFYEHFLAAYDRQLKIQRGVFYTPQPVVSYIVRSVHELLQTEFGLADGFASTVTWGEMVKKNPELKLPALTDELKETLTVKPSEILTISPEEPFVQILDPATGTATFLVEVIDVIYRHLAANWDNGGLAAMPTIANPPKGTPAPRRFEDYWNVYVPHALLPRLHGYELMMAPYTIAHMKIGLKLAETGYRFSTEQRAQIYLTNALEPKVSQLPQIGFDALAHEAAAVNEVKWYKRFTVVIGNPPYSNYGQLNKNSFIIGLLEDYKRSLNEKKLNLDDDFIKFIRFSQNLLDETGVGALGMITNNVFLDGLTHRRMRESLNHVFQMIHILNLHGDTRKKEECPTEEDDKNVFDIQQGVTIALFSKTLGKTERSFFHADLWGTRDKKYCILAKADIGETRWQSINPTSPYFFFVPKEFADEDEYRQAVSVKDVFIAVGKGVKTERDGVSIHFTSEDITQAVSDFKRNDAETLRRKFELGEDSRDWKVASAKADVIANDQAGRYRNILYRPFDVRNTWYSGQTRGFIGTPGYPVMRHMLSDNLALILTRQVTGLPYNHCFATRFLVEIKCVSHDRCCDVIPWKICDADALSLNSPVSPNLKPGFLNTLSARLKLPQKGVHGCPAGLTPEDIFHYAYAVFHSPGYRSRYAEFLKIDFPRLPLTGSLELFRALAGLGGELVSLHLLESPKLDKPLTEFIGARNPEVEKVTWSKNTVWVDKAQTTGFKGVPEDVWNFHIGGYQVCEKWLKDRKNRTLSKDDIAHYQKVVVALAETIRLMAEIDKVIAQHGGWPGAFAVSGQSPAPVSAAKSPPPDLGLRTEDELPLG